MGKINFNLPLPKENLHKRYYPVFDALKRGFCSTVVGLPLSSRSAFLKFIIETPEVLNEFLDTNKYKFIISDYKNINDSNLLKIICIKISEIFEIYIENNFDPLILQSKIENIILNQTKPIKIVIFIPDFYEVLSDKPETVQFLTRIWKINKHNNQKSGILFCLTASPKEIEKVNINFPFDITQIVNESKINFDLFDKNEIEYTRKRLEYFLNKRIDDSTHKLAYKLSGGHYVLYKTLVDFDKTELNKIAKTLFHPLLAKILENIWINITNKTQESIVNQIPLLPPRKIISTSDKNKILELTAQEHNLFEFLKSKENLIITRDEIAQAIWRGNWENKYSDWAIDKLISKLKSKLIYSNFRIITFRNQGYKLTKYD